MKLSNEGHLMNIFIEDITYTTVEVSNEMVAQIKAQGGRNWQPALISKTSKPNQPSTYKCNMGHELISAVALAGEERVWCIITPDQALI
jgi:hypothetical protein